VPRAFSTRGFFPTCGGLAFLLVLAIAALFHVPWLATALFAAVLIGTLVLYQRLMRRHIQELVGAADMEDLSPPAAGEALEVWARRHVAATSLKLAESRDLLDSLFDILQDGIFLLDSENRILRANAAAVAMLGHDLDHLVGAPLAQAANQEALANLATKVRDTCTYQSSEIYLPSIPGPGHVGGIPLRRGQTDCCRRLLFVVRDLTQIRRLESAGEEYATNVSHELKTPLTLILGYAETLLAHGDMDPGFRERSLRTIERHTKRIIRIIDDLMRLAWLRNEAGAAGIPRASTSVADAIDNAVAICREWARTAGIDIESHVPEGLVWHLNAGLIEEAMVNLIKNAILYALTGPVEIRVRILDNGNLEIAVSDRGPGLKPEDATRIFDRFYRADKGRARASGGSGLGLPIVQQIIEAHHGSTRVETAPGAGCTFLLEIPPAI
jgi:two-component system, OmpR family, phosphate regulon sensor histidine kinase PhoR